MPGYFEPANELSPQARDISRALNSLREEIEAIDYYNQRVDVANDQSIAGIMAHNRDEEIEHAVMTLEWLRRSMPVWDEQMQTYLFTQGDITTLETAGEAEEAGTGENTGGQSSGQAGDLGIGSLKNKQ